MLNNNFLNWYLSQVQLQPASNQEPAPGNPELSQQQNPSEENQYAPKFEVTESVELEVPVPETQKIQIDDAVDHPGPHCNSEQSQESLQSHRTFTCGKCGQVGHDSNPQVKNIDGIESSTVSLCEQCNKKSQTNQIPQQQQQQSVTSQDQDLATAVELLQQLQLQQQLFQAQQNLRSMEYLQGQNMVMQMQRMQQGAMLTGSLYDAGSSIRRSAG